MQHRTWHTYDKSDWGLGPWQDEPDKEQWEDETTGLPCLLKRNPYGALCGYVGVPEGHPWFAASYDSVDAHDIVHGGLTFADFCAEGPPEASICHVPDPGDPDPVWWLGFDCGHCFDFMPGMRAREAGLMLPTYFDDQEVYRDRAYVRAECAKLARAIVAAADLDHHDEDLLG